MTSREPAGILHSLANHSCDDRFSHSCISTDHHHTVLRACIIQPVLNSVKDPLTRICLESLNVIINVPSEFWPGKFLEDCTFFLVSLMSQLFDRLPYFLKTHCNFFYGLLRLCLRLFNVLQGLQLWLDILFTNSPLNQHVNIILLSTFLCLQPIYFRLIKTKTHKNTTNFSPQSRESWCINTSGCHMTIQDIAIELNPCKVSLTWRVTWKWFSVPSWGGRG